MNKIKYVFAALASLVALTSGAKDKNNPDQLTVMSYNIRYGEAKDGSNSWEYRYFTSAMMIEDVKPDIFGLQEALGFQVHYMDEYTKGYKSVGVGRENGRKEGEIMAIFYNSKKISLQKWGTFWLSETPEKPSMGWDAVCKRTATWALMKDKNSGRRFFFVNTHLDHVGVEARIKGLELIVNRIAEINPDNLPMVLTGDFNTDADDSILDGLNGIMNSARSEAVITDTGDTFNGWGKGHGVIDHIYFFGFSSCPSFEVIRKPYGDHKFISDHYPVMATLIF